MSSLSTSDLMISTHHNISTVYRLSEFASCHMSTSWLRSICAALCFTWHRLSLHLACISCGYEIINNALRYSADCCVLKPFGGAGPVSWTCQILNLLRWSPDVEFAKLMFSLPFDWSTAISSSRHFNRAITAKVNGLFAPILAFKQSYLCVKQVKMICVWVLFKYRHLCTRDWWLFKLELYIYLN